jgi:hypothetical protein
MHVDPLIYSQTNQTWNSLEVEGVGANLLGVLFLGFKSAFLLLSSEPLG